MTEGETMGDPNDRLLDALENSTKTTTEVMGKIKGMTREFDVFREATGKEFAWIRETINKRLGDLEDEMRSTNAHLDNLVRETVVTNQLLREDMEDRKRTQEHRHKLEDEDRDWRRKMEERQLTRKEQIEDDNRSTTKKYMDEAWGVLKQPFGYLVAGIIFWLLLRYFAVPPAMMAAPTSVPAGQIEQVYP